MTTFHIKSLAAALMFCDHIGAIFFPKILVFRFIGRLSFTLFAWLIGQGEKHTKNFNIYLLRLLILGLLSQPLYSMVFHTLKPNILATLALGLLAIRLNKLTPFNLLFPCTFAALAQLTNSSYGAYGVFLIVLLSKFDSTSIAWWIKWSLLNLLTLFLPCFPFYQFLALLTPIILLLCNGKQGRKAKWFYSFYPLHLALILLVRLLILSN